MYAIIRTGGKQYRVSEGDVLEVEKLNVQEGDEVVFDDVLTVVSCKRWGCQGWQTDCRRR